MSETTIRDATLADLPQIVEIMNYYIENTIISLRMELLTVDKYQEIFTFVCSQKLPFFISETDGRVTGFAYASGFPDSEITIYVHHEYHNGGVGSHLMNNLIGEIKKPRNPDAPDIKQLLSIMSLNGEGPGKGYGLRDWYGRWGFVQVGHLKNVGNKDGKRVDVLITQASLE
ncbi:acyl-CoA N-acyltransferase [Gymnopilus junonius]|uniref:Acyl-CoA N-acyltransferase n=1 Tax=Gymnopilus junonius TaxID=109634 RepID=A0A9P5TLM6_GYMJU|nr:acyl-CoA N-acyltransferase [Gymnopilus junonius]